MARELGADWHAAARLGETGLSSRAATPGPGRIGGVDLGRVQMEYIVNYIVAGLLAVVALVALVQTTLSRRSDRWSRPRLRADTETDNASDDVPEQSYQQDVKDRRNDPR